MYNLELSIYGSSFFFLIKGKAGKYATGYNSTKIGHSDISSYQVKAYLMKQDSYISTYYTGYNTILEGSLALSISPPCVYVLYGQRDPGTQLDAPCSTLVEENE